MDKKVRWGVLGVAKIATTQSDSGDAARSNVAKWRPSPRAISTKRGQAAADLGIPKAYGSYEELLADPEIDAIYNPLPNHLHVPWSKRRPKRASTCCAKSRSRSTSRKFAT